MMTIKEAYAGSGMTQQELAKRLGVPKRTLQDWMYAERHPRNEQLIVDKINALSMLTPEGRDSMTWNEILEAYRVEQARNLSKIGRYRDTFSRSLDRVPESCQELTAQQLADIVDALHEAFEAGKVAEKGGEKVKNESLCRLYNYLGVSMADWFENDKRTGLLTEETGSDGSVYFVFCDDKNYIAVEQATGRLVTDEVALDDLFERS